MMLQGVRLPNGEVVRDETAEAALATGWAPTFAAKARTAPLGRAFLDEYGKRLDLSGIRDPSLASFEALLKRVPSSAPGPDGVPFAAWQAMGRAAA